MPPERSSKQTRSGRAPRLQSEMSDFEELIYGQYSSSMGTDDFLALMRPNTNRATPTIVEQDDDLLAEVLVSDKPRLSNLLRKMQGRVDGDTARLLLSQPKPTTPQDRWINVAYAKLYQDLRLSATGKQYRAFKPDNPTPNVQLAVKLSRALDKVLVFVIELGCDTNEYRLTILRRLVKLLQSQINLKAVGGNTGGLAMERYEQHAIACLSQFKAVLAQQGINTRAQYRAALRMDRDARN